MRDLETDILIVGGGLGGIAGALAALRLGRKVRLADSLFNLPVLTIPQAQDILQVTYRSAQANVGKLVEMGVLRPIDKSLYRRVFIASEILAALAEEASGTSE